jgi:hypothetical protein
MIPFKKNLIFSCDEFNPNYQNSFCCMNRQWGGVGKSAQEKDEQLVQGSQERQRKS